MIRCRAWGGKALRGAWRVYRKLDGVRALRAGEGRARRIVSRNGKPLYNLGAHGRLIRDCEVWLGDFTRTIQAVKTHARIRIPRSALYALDPPDPRLYLRTVRDPQAATIRALLAKHRRPGEDGLVLRQGTTWLKVKHVVTYDVEVTGVQPGRGRHRGRLGALLTPMGKVGTGFSDAQRHAFYAAAIVGQVVEVASTGLTPDGKFRHARFVRVRSDK